MSPYGSAHIRAEIDLEALRHNVRGLRELAGGVPIMAAVKADAYGHGVELVVPVLREEQVEAFGVASVAEGIALRATGVSETVLVFADAAPEQLADCASHDLDVTVGSAESARAVRESGHRLRVHLKVDTGMHRLGVMPEHAAAILDQLGGTTEARVVALWTHLATADEDDVSFARQQIAAFDALLRSLDADGLDVHIANSGAIVQIPEAVRGRQFVRPGGLLYGLHSTGALERQFDARPVMRLVSRVVSLRTIAAGESVSYGRTWRATRPTRIATVAAGYGDGLPRHLSNRGEAAINGERFEIAGRICMDMLMLDLGPPDGPGSTVHIGDDVVLFGRGGPSALAAATAAGTLSYTLTAALTSRVVRVPAATRLAES